MLDGWHFPWITTEQIISIFLSLGFGEILSSIIVLLIGVAVFAAKTGFFLWLFVWVRWTLPRFRYDQLMHLGWKVLLPLGLLNILVTSLIMQLKGV